MKIEIKLREQDHHFNSKYGEEVITYFMQASRESLMTEIKKETPVDYGLLRRSWAYKHYKVGGAQKLRVSNSREYGIFVEEGTGLFKTGNLIYPKNKRAFRAKIGGETVYFKSHTGMKGRHMMKKGVEHYSKRIPNLFRTAVHRTALKSKK